MFALPSQVQLAVIPVLSASTPLSSGATSRGGGGGGPSNSPQADAAVPAQPPSMSQPKSLKDMFAPREEAGCSLFRNPTVSGVEIGLNLEEEEDVYPIATTTINQTSVAAAAAAVAPITAAPAPVFRNEAVLFDCSSPMFFPILPSDRNTRVHTVNKEKSNVQALQDKLDAINCKHGDAYTNGIQPVFKPLKACHFDPLGTGITDESLLEYMQYYVDCCNPGCGETYWLGKEFGQQLINNCQEVLGEPPLYKDVMFPIAPHMEVTPAGDIIYMEVICENIRKLEAYVEEIFLGPQISTPPTTLPED
ncbi:hypothetical protein BS47DRAFT_1430128 [Hydnum rufescens UP504]|uniref:Fatty acid synthase type I helical domain-containing protein n=1 Tax=Hydnum rufescens UP504 TaxID=1448309 RepID=A0A9P6AIN5_9AGAM|nr:hypothetical protein BS47DRAFT_1430128 [Hydnum rufescens UP504]